LHSEGGVLIDRTLLPNDFISKTVCGQVNSISPFALARPIEPQTTKRQVLNNLTALRASPNLTQNDVAKLDDAIKQLLASLDASLWIDQFHLQPQNGDQDFDAEKVTVNKLRELLLNANSSIARTTLQQLIDAIVGADRVLALTALSDALAAHGNENE